MIPRLKFGLKGTEDLVVLLKGCLNPLILLQTPDIYTFRYKFKHINNY